MTKRQWAALEREINENGPVVLWGGSGKFPGGGLRGLGFSCFEGGLEAAISGLAKCQLSKERMNAKCEGRKA